MNNFDHQVGLTVKYYILATADRDLDSKVRVVVCIGWKPRGGISTLRMAVIPMGRTGPSRAYPY